MKFLLLSDNHGRWPQTHEVIQQWRGKVDYIFHLGDSEFAYDDPIWEDVDAKVTGNMDFDPDYPFVEVVETPVGRVFLAHGHQHGVNHGLENIVSQAREAGASYVFHGHTHVLYAKRFDDILAVNPGSLNHSRGMVRNRTYAVVTVDEAKQRVEFYDESGDLLDQLTQEFER
ncbi:YfcE family phosphodiesterase [Suicoccus acidiformans]|uniref:Phosphoesterase n=1 Tax=Suicoccus acidiformans TaxID=2036206 RepID=A0A347WJU5_9LACT|nr:metallophosphoesterase [Suicoccus acidiformans]AXY25352.1 YfcE family phosphodiesterase [Suicoccus acidiformans]